MVWVWVYARTLTLGAFFSIEHSLKLSVFWKLFIFGYFFIQVQSPSVVNRIYSSQNFIKKKAF